MLSPRVLKTSGVLVTTGIFCIGAFTGCADEAEEVPTAATEPLQFSVADQLDDPVMGELSGIALALAIALDDASLRKAVAAELRKTAANPVGMNLQDCGDMSLSNQLFTAAGKRLNVSPAVMCQFAKSRVGLVLYLDRDRAAQWDGREIPIVTALANPTAVRPSHFQGYRVPDEPVLLPSDGSIGGAVLVVLPLLHATWRSAKRPDVTVGNGRGQP